MTGMISSWKSSALMRADVAVVRKFFQLLAVRAFSSADDGREDHDAVVWLADFAVQDGLNNLLAGLTRDGLAAIRAVRDAHGRVNDAKIIVNFGNGADGGTRRTRGGLLLDGNGRREPLDDVDLGALHLFEELPRVRRERCHVTALSFGINSVKGE